MHYIKKKMKKLTILLIIAIVAISFTACKKDRVCECTSDGIITKVTINEATKRQGKANCISTTSDDGNGGFEKEVCELK